MITPGQPKPRPRHPPRSHHAPPGQDFAQPTCVVPTARLSRERLGGSCQAQRGASAIVALPFIAIMGLCIATGCASQNVAREQPDRQDKDLGSVTARAVDAAGDAARETGVGMREAARETRAGVGDAARQPLKDIGLVREDIPQILLAIDYAYMPPPSPSCAVIAQEVTALDAVLGPDQDSPLADKSLGERGGEVAGDVILDAVRSGAASVIPARGVVRWISGADRHDKKVNQAIERGQLRRAYLKGLGEALGCKPPAAPLPPPEKPKSATQGEPAAARPTAGVSNVSQPPN
jgi:hypothetical protein